MKNGSWIITKMFFKLLPVQIILVAIGSLNGIIDGAMASNLIGAEALTATGIFGPMVTLTNMIFMMPIPATRSEKAAASGSDSTTRNTP